MKNKLKLFISLLGITLLLTGCGKADLYSAYKKMSVGSGKNQISGYQVNIRLYGLYNGEKVSDIFLVQNYLNKGFKIVDSNNNKTYYRVNGVNYEYIAPEKDNDELGLGYDFGATIGEDGEIVEETGTYEKTDKKVPFTDTDLFLKTLLKAKSVEKPVTEEISGEAYQKYSFKVSKAVMKRVIADTSVNDINITKDTNASCWVDKDGYVYKIVFDLKSGSKIEDDLTLAVFFAAVNNVSEINEDSLK